MCFWEIKISSFEPSVIVSVLIFSFLCVVDIHCNVVGLEWGDAGLNPCSSLKLTEQSKPPCSRQEWGRLVRDIPPTCSPGL